MTSKLALAALALLVLAAVPAAAEEPLFHDGFELGELCSWSSSPAPPIVAETSSANDTVATAQPIARCAVVAGAVDSLGDFDFYAVAVDRPTLLRLTLAAGDEPSDYEPYADVDDAAQGGPLGMTPLAVDAATTRQILLPAAGTWYVFVADQRNWDRANLEEIVPPTAGGADTTYRLSLEVEPLAGQFALAGSAQPFEIAADGALVVFELDAGQTSVLDLAEIFAERLGSPSPLDARLYVIADPHGAPATIASCDDLRSGGDCVNGAVETVDPVLESVALDVLEPHLVVVDFYDAYDPVSGISQPLPAAFELDLQFLPPAP